MYYCLPHYYLFLKKKYKKCLNPSTLQNVLVHEILSILREQLRWALGSLPAVTLSDCVGKNASGGQRRLVQGSATCLQSQLLRMGGSLEPRCPSPAWVT